jgi:hypothetical protein
METLVAVGEQQVGDVMSVTCPFGECATAEEFGVIRVGEYNKDVLWGIPCVGVCQFYYPVSDLDGDDACTSSRKILTR